MEAIFFAWCANYLWLRATNTVAPSGRNRHLYPNQVRQGLVCTWISESDQAGTCPEAGATRAEAKIIDFYDYSWCEYITPTTSAIINEKRGCSRIQQTMKNFPQKKIALSNLYNSDFARLAFTI